MRIETRAWRSRAGRYDYRIDGGEWQKLEWGCVVVLDGGMEGQVVNRTELAKRMGWSNRQCRYHTQKGLASLKYPLQRGGDYYEDRLRELATEFWPKASSASLKSRRQRVYREREKQAAISDEELAALQASREKRKRAEELAAMVIAKDRGDPLLTRFATMRF